MTDEAKEVKRKAMAAWRKRNPDYQREYRRKKREAKT
jgi:hypothetical protein